MDGDPLGLRRLVAREIRAAFRLLDADRVLLRLMARLAHGATVQEPGMEASWIRAEARRAMDDVLRSERSAVARARAADPSGLEALPRDDRPFDALAVPLGLSGLQLRAACDAFNRRSPGERQAFFVLFVEHRSLEGAAALCGTSGVEVARAARAALLATLVAAGMGTDPGSGQAAEPLHPTR